MLGALEESLVSDTSYDVECRIVQPGGTRRFVPCRGVVIRNVAGNPIRILGTVQDRTADARCEPPVERVVRESRDQRDLVAQAVHVGIFEWDHRTGCVYWSPILRDIVGMSADATASLRRYVKLICGADRERILPVIRSAVDSVSNGHVQVEHRIVRPDGTVRHISLKSLTRVKGEGSSRIPSRTTGTVVDITDHMLAEAYRREASKLMTARWRAGLYMNSITV